jgi:hypothetical protein
MKIKLCIAFLLIFIALYIANFYYEKTENHFDNNFIRIYIGQTSEIASWKFECMPLGNVVWERSSVIRKFLFISFVSPYEDYWDFYPKKPGKVTICFLKYEGNEWLYIDESYAEDYIVDENLKIFSLGNKRPIYEIEKYDRYLFEQYLDDHYLNINLSLVNYPNVTYSLTSNYDTRTVDILIKGARPDNESDLHTIIEDYLSKRFQDLDEIMHNTKINIMFE